MQPVTNLISSNSVAVSGGRGQSTDYEYIVVSQRSMTPLEIVGFYVVIILIGIAAVFAMWRLSRRKN